MALAVAKHGRAASASFAFALLSKVQLVYLILLIRWLLLRSCQKPFRSNRLQYLCPNRVTVLVGVDFDESRRVSIHALLVTKCHMAEKLNRLRFKFIRHTRTSQSLCGHFGWQVKPQCQLRLQQMLILSLRPLFECR